MSKAVETPGQMARAALQREGHVADVATTSASPASVPLVVQPGANGSARLVHAETGQVMGQCVSEEIANATRNFLK